MLLAKVAGNVLYYNDTSVTNRVTYSYQVSANNTAGEGPRSATAVAMPNWPASMPVINITAPTDFVHQGDGGRGGVGYERQRFRCGLLQDPP